LAGSDGRVGKFVGEQRIHLQRIHLVPPIRTDTREWHEEIMAFAVQPARCASRSMIESMDTRSVRSMCWQVTCGSIAAGSPSSNSGTRSQRGAGGDGGRR
jgi:hypothetical protein